MHFGEITAGNLLKINHSGDIIDQGTSKFGFQKTGNVIHSAIHESRPDLSALIHIHSRAGIAVSSSGVERMEHVWQTSYVCDPLSYHKYHGIAG